MPLASRIRFSIAVTPKLHCRSGRPNTAQVLFNARGHQEELRTVRDVFFTAACISKPMPLASAKPLVGSRTAWLPEAQ
jgi:hypothetical protein